ncbi:hypothetical protein [Cohnella zeiphila]|uniref:Uncharacterized protein n=1 Tax=Cohnella zeiphila TaxID=2761120 RepID=A0A7X0VYC1_9BACL|nr:hypothetical protein [Cohnella zeiphila]MBB6734871.1 hypothetical protein [Cohnella zeiphila]
MQKIQRIENPPLGRIRPWPLAQEEILLTGDLTGYSRPGRGRSASEPALSAGSLPASVDPSDDPRKYATYNTTGRAILPSPPIGLLLDARS